MRGRGKKADHLVLAFHQLPRSIGFFFSWNIYAPRWMAIYVCSAARLVVLAGVTHFLFHLSLAPPFLSVSPEHFPSANMARTVCKCIDHIPYAEMPGGTRRGFIKSHPVSVPTGPWLRSVCVCVCYLRTFIRGKGRILQGPRVAIHHTVRAERAGWFFCFISNSIQIWGKKADHLVLAFHQLPLCV